MSTKHGGGMTSEAPSGVFDWRRAMNESASDDSGVASDGVDAERFGFGREVTAKARL